MCWTIVGYTLKNFKGVKDFKGNGKKISVREQGKFQSKWNKGKQDGRAKMRANSRCRTQESSGGGKIAQQLEQLLRMFPLPSKDTKDDSGNDMDANYAKMIDCNLAHSNQLVWIIDSGATHHMIGC